MDKNDYKNDLNIVIEEKREYENHSALPKQRQELNSPSFGSNGILNDKIEDYRAMAQKVIDAKQETIRLTKQFEIL